MFLWEFLKKLEVKWELGSNIKTINFQPMIFFVTNESSESASYLWSVQSSRINLYRVEQRALWTKRQIAVYVNETLWNDTNLKHYQSHLNGPVFPSSAKASRGSVSDWMFFSEFTNTIRPSSSTFFVQPKGKSPVTFFILFVLGWTLWWMKIINVQPNQADWAT